MAFTNTKITDLVPSEKVLSGLVNLILAQKNELVTSGLAARGPEVDAVASGGPRKSSLPYLNPLATDAVNVSTDDMSVEGSVGKLTGDEYTVLRNDLNYAWATADLTRLVTQYDAKGGIQAGIADYWNAIFQKYAYASIAGVKAAVDAAIAAGVAGGASADVVARGLEMATLKAGVIGTDLSMATIYNSIATSGEYADMFDTLIVSPTQYAKWQGAEANSFVPASKTETGFANYQGFKLIRSKAFGLNTTVACRMGGLAFGTGTVDNALEIERKANAGNGAGGDILHSRQSFVVHPQGTNYLGSVAPTDTQLASAANWDVAVPIEQFGFRFITHKA